MKRSYLRGTRTALAALAALALIAAGCGGDDSESKSPSGSASGEQSDVTLTMYTDQHDGLIDGLTEAYTAETGVGFDIQYDATVGQIEAEGAASQADVFLSEDPTPVAQLGAADLLEPVDKSTLDQVLPGLSSTKGQWVAYAARSRVLYYNPDEISEEDLPKTLFDIVDPKYQGEFAWAPSGAFVATTQYLLSTEGEAKTREFLDGIKANGINEQKNGNVRDTVEAGKHAMGLSNHYYWWILADEVGGPDKLTSKIYHFPTEDPGNLILASGAAILKASDQADEGQKFLAWLTSKDGGQKLIADADIEVSGAQYPVAPGLESSVAGDLGDVKSPTFDMDVFIDTDQAQKLLKELGMSSG